MHLKHKCSHVQAVKNMLSALVSSKIYNFSCKKYLQIVVSNVHSANVSLFHGDNGSNLLQTIMVCVIWGMVREAHDRYVGPIEGPHTV